MNDIVLAKLSAGIAATLGIITGITLAVTDAVLISITTSIAAVLMAGISAYFAYRAKVVSEETHKTVNSRMSEFLELAKTASVAEGKLAGKEEEKSKRDALDVAQAKGAAIQKTVDQGGVMPQ